MTNSFAETRRHVAVVGFGMAGATASALLRRAGHHVTAFERAPVLGPVGAGVLLQPSGQLVLDHLGLLAATLEHAEPIEELYATQVNGRTLIRMPYAAGGADLRAYGIHRGSLFTVLHDHAKAVGVSVYPGTEIRGVDETTAAVRLQDTCGRWWGPYDVVLACDGAGSALRSSCGLRSFEHEYAYGAVWAVGPSRAVVGHLRQIVHTTRDLFGLLPTGHGQLTLFGSVRNDHVGNLRQRGLAAWKASVLAKCPLAEEVLASIHDLDELRITRYRHVHMPRVHTRRVAFLGDAAHAMSPHLGQGVNLALLDAWALAKAVATQNDISTSLRVYAAARRAHLRFYASITFLLAPFFQSDLLPLGWLRDLALPLLPRVPVLRGQMALTMAGMKADLLRGRLQLS